MICGSLLNVTYKDFCERLYISILNETCKQKVIWWYSEKGYLPIIPLVQKSHLLSFAFVLLSLLCFCFSLSHWVGTLFTQRSSITSLHYSTIIFRVDVPLCARYDWNLLYVDCFLLLCHCIHNAKLKSSRPFLEMERHPLWCGVMERGKHG